MKLPQSYYLRLGEQQREILSFLLLKKQPVSVKEVQEILGFPNYFSVWRSIQLLKENNLVEKIGSRGYVISEEGYKEWIRRKINETE